MTQSVDNGEIRGAILPDVEARGDKAEIDNLRRAEDKHGMKTGARFLDGKEGVVSFLGYPKPRFFFQFRRSDGTYEDAVEMTKEVYEQTYTIRL